MGIIIGIIVGVVVIVSAGWWWHKGRMGNYRTKSRGEIPIRNSSDALQGEWNSEFYATAQENSNSELYDTVEEDSNWSDESYACGKQHVVVMTQQTPPPTNMHLEAIDHGNIDRSTAEHRLTGKGEGSYLLRRKQEGHIVVSYVTRSGISHFLSVVEGNGYRVNGTFVTREVFLPHIIALLGLRCPVVRAETVL